MKTCDECGGPYYAKGKCCKHYFKSRRKTTRQLIPEGAECSVEGCTKQVRCKGMCRYHYDKDRGYRKPTPNQGQGKGSPGVYKKQVVGYRAAHIRVEATKGKATDYSCIDCGGKAREWSLNPNAIHTYEDGNKVWSLNTDDYDPRCVPCHRDLDGGYSWRDYQD